MVWYSTYAIYSSFTFKQTNLYSETENGMAPASYIPIPNPAQFLASGAREVPPGLWEPREPQRVAGEGGEGDCQPGGPQGGPRPTQKPDQCI